LHWTTTGCGGTSVGGVIVVEAQFVVTNGHRLAGTNANGGSQKGYDEGKPRPDSSGKVFIFPSSS
jgi:hypothetical protein